jgi:hypothetical protein
VLASHAKPSRGDRNRAVEGKTPEITVNQACAVLEIH